MKGEHSTGWTVREVEDGLFSVFYHGQRWPMEPRASRQSCIDYARRLADRWTHEGALLMLRERDSGRSRGGPWRYTYPVGEDTETGVIQTSRLSDAKKLLRRELNRERLPNGISWTVDA